MVKEHFLISPKEQRSWPLRLRRLNVKVNKKQQEQHKKNVKWWLHTVCQALYNLKDHYIQSFVGQNLLKKPLSTLHQYGIPYV